MTFANNLDPDEAPQNVGPHLRSKLFDGAKKNNSKEFNLFHRSDLTTSLKIWTPEYD